MSTKAADPATSVEVEQTETDASNDAVTKALAHVDSIVDKVTKSMGQSSAPVAAPAEPATAASTETEVEKCMSLKTMLAKAGISGDVAKTAMATFEKETGMKADAKFAPEDAKGTKTKKAAEEPAAAAAPAPDAENALSTLADAVTKAAAFTPARIAKIQEAVDTLKLVLQGIAPAQSPATSTPAVTTHPNPNTTAVLTKAENSEAPQSTNADVAKALSEFSAIVKSLGERIEAVEKAKPVSNSAEQDKTVTQTPVKKGLWAGVL